MNAKQTLSVVLVISIVFSCVSAYGLAKDGTITPSLLSPDMIGYNFAQNREYLVLLSAMMSYEYAKTLTRTEQNSFAQAIVVSDSYLTLSKDGIYAFFPVGDSSFVMLSYERSSSSTIQYTILDMGSSTKTIVLGMLDYYGDNYYTITPNELTNGISTLTDYAHR